MAGIGELAGRQPAEHARSKMKNKHAAARRLKKEQKSRGGPPRAESREQSPQSSHLEVGPMVEPRGAVVSTLRARPAPPPILVFICTFIYLIATHKQAPICLTYLYFPGAT